MTGSTPGAEEPPRRRIIAVELVRVRLPLRRVLDSAHGRESVREVVLVRAVDEDGVEGWGECSALELPTYTSEYTDGAWAVLRDHLVPALLEVEATGRIRGFVGHPMAQAAVTGARLDVVLRAQDAPLAGTLAGLVGPPETVGLSWTAVLGLARDVDQTLAEAGAAVAAGAGALKLKIAPSMACEPVIAAVIDAFPSVPVAVDANGSFWHDRGQLPAIAALLAGSGPDAPAADRDGPYVPPRRYVEQPLEAGDLVGHADLAPTLGVPIALDESIDGAGALAVADRLDACGLVNLKPARVGGISAAIDLFLAPEGRPAAFLGGMLETGVGRATALGVGAALGLDATDLGPSSWYFDDDLTEPIGLGADGRMHVPDGPGIGVTPRPDRLADVAVDRLTIRR